MSNSLVRTARRLLGLMLLALSAAGTTASAQTLSPLAYFFLATPNGSVVADTNGNLYGTSTSGSGAPGGFIYRLKSDASSIDTIYQYGRLDVWTGALPASGLVLDSNTLYGVTTASAYDQRRAFTTGNGITGTGTIFSVDVNGQGYQKLYEFEPLTTEPVHSYLINTNGALPRAGLTRGVEGGIAYLYGVAYQGGVNGTGTVFRIRQDGSGGLTLLGSFAEALRLTDDSGFDKNPDNQLKNANGMNPDHALFFGGDGYLYGTTRAGGANGTGVVFRVPTTGGAIQAIHTFDAIVPAVTSTDSNGVVTVVTPAHNNDGAYPSSGPVIATDSNGLRYLYGTTAQYGPVNKIGTIYRIALDGSNTFTKVVEFDGSNGAAPSGQLIVGTGNVLIGTASAGGTPASTTVTGTPAGIIYRLPLNDSTSYTLSEVYRFTAENSGTNGSSPSSGVIETTDGSLYGVTAGGANGQGVIFKYGTAPTNGPLGIQPPYDDGGGFMDAKWLIAFLVLGFAANRMRRRSAR